MIRLSLLGLSFLFYFFCNGQIDTRKQPYSFDIINDKESKKFFIESESRNSTGITDPPEGPLRTMAEWEELDGVIITWASEFTILAQIVDAVKEEANVYIVCSNPSQVQNFLDQVSVDWSENVFFLEEPFNTIWVRDYGPNSVYQNDVDSLILVDWIYNRPARVRDDGLPEAIADDLELSVFATVTDPYRFVGTGGNFMSDGMGKGFSSELILEENPMLGLDGVNDVLEDFMGIEDYIKFDALPFDVINHIDMHMKLLDEQTIMVGKYPEGVADGPQIEANIEYLLSNFTTSFGTPFKVVRMPMPPSFDGSYPNQGGDYRTYVNSLIVNKSILIPTYEEQYDSTALRIWSEAMPGYNLVGINCNAIIPRFGALHCITKEVGVKEPLRIVHQERQCVENISEAFDISAVIQHREGIQEAIVHLKSNADSDYKSYPLTLTDPDTDTWSTSVSSIAEGIFNYEYYFTAVANNGKEMNSPMVAPAGVYNVEDCLFSSTKIPLDESPEFLDIFPNPASAITCIPLELNKSRDIELSLHDMLGRKVQIIFQGQAPIGASKYFFDAGKLQAGIYLVKLSDKASTVFQKVVVN